MKYLFQVITQIFLSVFLSKGAKYVKKGKKRACVKEVEGTDFV